MGSDTGLNAPEKGCGAPAIAQGLRLRLDQMLSPFAVSLCFGLLLPVLVTTLALCHPAEGRAGDRSILFLHSYHQGMLWTDEVSEGFCDRLDVARPDIELFIEYMDTKRYPGPAHRRRLLEFYREKYAGKDFDVLVACDDNAFRFALAHRSSLFPKTPLIFCGVNFYTPDMLRGVSRVAGVVENIDVAETLRLALGLHPETERVVVVNDTTPTGRANKQLLDGILPGFADRVDFQFLEELSMPELTKRLGELGPKAIVLLLSFNRDAEGNVFTYRESIARISKACPVPIYGVWGFYLGRGIVGGQLTTGKSQGRTAAELSLRVLNGEGISGLGVRMDAPTRAMFDYEQLVRFNRSKVALPPGSRLINEPRSFFAENRNLVLMAASAFLALLVVILSLSLLLKRLQRIRRFQEQSERQLRESRQSLVQILDSLPDATFGIDRQGRVLFWNKAIETMTGVPAADIIGKGEYEYSLPFYSERRPVMLDLVLNWDDGIAQKYSYIKQEGDVLISETRNPHFQPDDSTFWNTARPLRDSDGQIIGAIEVIRDISEIKRTERELLRAERSIQNIINSMPSLLITLTPEGRITQWNTEAARISGIPAEKAIGRSLEELMPDLAGRPAIREAIRTGETKTVNKISAQRGKEDRYFNLTVYPLLSDGLDGIVIREDDVTDQVRLEEMMLQSEKMLTVGGLAAGMAHEINNPLSGIIGNVDLVLRRLQPNQAGKYQAPPDSYLDPLALEDFLREQNVYARLGRIRDAAGRAAKIVNDMLFFSRTSQLMMFKSDLRRLMDQALDLAATEYNLKKDYDFRSIEVVKDYQPDMPLVECEPNQMQQVFLNILANGAQAMAESQPRKSSAERLSPPRFDISIRRDGRTALIEIADNGPGMTEKVRRKVFEPFFTTKEVGKGTGLGLSVSYFIVTEHHGGSIQVLSEPGAGSSFIISLPLRRGI